ncbi:RNA polymerase sigma factor [Curvibacter sp. PAE-UM]|uniref:RNA polymerase sigma factor n=1 Tax=Curvibacter sp. PAE-UM TaxID=1714344 RepID=UPI00070D4A80|nr:sigma-70 family RNA polymerase sigma factor [Curvibacter sp. PAE-UM]KRH99336.1 RNA polymerase subunit sigma-24 [Curvibacter sp. PAE-UM]
MFLTSETRYNQWVRDHYRFLMRSAWALTGSRAVAEDVVQDCYTNAWKHRDQLRDLTLVRPWLFQIMRRSIFRHLPPCTVSLDDSDEGQWGEAADAGIDNRLDVVKALSRIAPIHREVLVLHYFDDMPTALIAEALEIAPGTVLSRLARARDALKSALVMPAQAPRESEQTTAPVGRRVTPLRKS